MNEIDEQSLAWLSHIQRELNQIKYWFGLVSALLALILWRVW